MATRSEEYVTKWCKVHGFVNYAPQYFHGKIQSWRCVKCREDSVKRARANCRTPGCPTETGDFGEYLVKSVIPTIKRADRGSRGDWICPDGRTFDVKTASLCHVRGGCSGEFCFDIRHNTEVDAFLLIALESKVPPVVRKAWWITGDEIVNGKRLNQKKTFSITPRKIDKFDKFVINHIGED